MKRRRSRFHFRPLHFVITLVVLLSLSLYSAFAFGTGPLSFLASRAEINEVTGKCSLASDEDECNDMASSCRWDGKYCKAKITGTIGSGPGGGGGNTPPVNPSKPEAGGQGEEDEEKNGAYCGTKGSPVKAGTWAVASGSKCAQCLDCARVGCNGRKVGFEFDPNSKNWMECSEVSIKTGGSVTYPGYAATAAERFCGKGATSCKSCFAKVNGRYIQIGIGQEISPGMYCAPDGNPVALKDLQTSMSKLCPDQQWVPGRGCQPIPAKEPTAKEKKLADAKKACEARTAKGEKVVWKSNACVGTVQTGYSATSEDQCASGIAEPVPGNEKYKFRCVDKKAEIIPCKPGLNPEDRDKSYITCNAGVATYHYCPNGVQSRSGGGYASAQYSCNPAPATPATPAQPATNAQTPTYICIGEMLYKKTLNSYGTYTTTLASGCGGLGCKDNKCNEPTPAQPATKMIDYISQVCKNGNQYTRTTYTDKSIKDEFAIDCKGFGCTDNHCNTATNPAKPGNFCGTDGWSWKRVIKSDGKPYESHLEYCQGNGCTDGKCNSATPAQPATKMIDYISQVCKNGNQYTRTTYTDKSIKDEFAIDCKGFGCTDNHCNTATNPAKPGNFCGTDGWSWKRVIKSDGKPYESHLEYCQGNGCTDGKCNSATPAQPASNFENAISKTVACQIHLLTWGPFGLPDYLRCRFGW